MGAEAPRLLQQSGNFILSEDIACLPWPGFAAEYRRWDFIARIVGSRIASKTDDSPQTVCSLRHLIRQTCPLDSGVDAYMLITSGLGKRQETP